MKAHANAVAAITIRQTAWPSSGFLQGGIESRLHWLFRCAVFLEFTGHGACGIHTKSAWLPYFHVFAIPDAMAWRLMPLIGSIDIALGVMALFRPCRALLVYMVVWGGFTALLRPAAGEGAWEFIERSYNYGVPLAFLLLHAAGRPAGWFAPLQLPAPLCAGSQRTLVWTLRIIVALMLVGHGGFGAFMGKANLLVFYRAAGLSHLGLPLEMLRAGIGFLEIGLGVLAVITNRPAFFGSICLWKLASESLYLFAGMPVACWEVVERGGSYLAPLALLCALAPAFGPPPEPAPAAPACALPNPVGGP